MTLPITPGSSLSLGQIRDEFSGTNPASLGDYADKVGKTASAGQNINFSDFSGLSSATILWNGETVNGSQAGTAANAEYWFYRNGTTTRNVGAGNVADEDWITPKSTDVGDSWNLVVNSITGSGGSYAGPSTGTYALTTTRSFALTQTAGGGFATRNISITIGSATFTLTLTANSTA